MRWSAICTARTEWESTASDRLGIKAVLQRCHCAPLIVALDTTVAHKPRQRIELPPHSPRNVGCQEAEAQHCHFDRRHFVEMEMISQCAGEWLKSLAGSQRGASL